MERVKSINNINITRAKSRTREVSIPLYYKSLILLSMVTILLFSFNYITYSSLATTAKVNYDLEMELEALRKENSLLEGIKADTLNMRQIEQKALELGFVYNNKVNYMK